MTRRDRLERANEPRVLRQAPRERLILGGGRDGLAREHDAHGAPLSDPDAERGRAWLELRGSEIAQR